MFKDLKNPFAMGCRYTAPRAHTWRAGGEEPRWGLSDPMMYFAGQLLCKFLFPTSIPALPVDGVNALNSIVSPRTETNKIPDYFAHLLSQFQGRTEATCRASCGNWLLLPRSMG